MSKPLQPDIRKRRLEVSFFCERQRQPGKEKVLVNTLDIWARINTFEVIALHLWP